MRCDCGHVEADHDDTHEDSAPCTVCDCGCYRPRPCVCSDAVRADPAHDPNCGLRRRDTVASPERQCVCGHRKSDHRRKGGVLTCGIEWCPCGPGCIHEGFVCDDGTVLDDERAACTCSGDPTTASSDHRIDCPMYRNITHDDARAAETSPKLRLLGQTVLGLYEASKLALSAGLTLDETIFLLRGQWDVCSKEVETCGVWNLNGKGGWCYAQPGDAFTFRGSRADAQALCDRLTAEGRGRHEVRSVESV